MAKPMRVDRFGQMLTDDNHCALCKSNREPVEVYMGHVLRDASGIIKCPVLRAFTCPICGATGDNSHTQKYCPQNATKSPPQQQLSYPVPVVIYSPTAAPGLFMASPGFYMAPASPAIVPRYKRVRNSTGEYHSLKY